MLQNVIFLVDHPTRSRLQVLQCTYRVYPLCYGGYPYPTANGIADDLADTMGRFPCCFE